MAFLVSLGFAAVKFAVLRAAPAYLAYRVEQHRLRESDGDGSFSPIPTEHLNEILFKKVIRVELWERPLDNYGEILGGVHRGVVIILEDGSRYLVHKTAASEASWRDVLGIPPVPPPENRNQVMIERPQDSSLATIIVADCTKMGTRWKMLESRRLRASKKVLDFIEACGTSYNLMTDNCNTAATRMMELSFRM